jgi:signal transduction histidine kinase
MIEYVPRSFRLRAPLPGDVRLTAAILAIIAFPYAVPVLDIRWGAGRFLLESASALPLMWRRQYPKTAVQLTGTITLAITATIHPAQPFPYAVLAAEYTIGSETRGRARQVLVALFVCGSVLAEVLHGRATNTSDYFLTFLTGITALLLGVLMQTQRAYVTALEERAAAMERDREAEIERAAAAERARIARDMHDVVGHAVALMVVQAEAGPLLVRARPEKAEAAFDAISAAGRDAMAQLRRLLGVLKQEDGTALRAPQPTLAMLEDLVAGVRHDELAVTLARKGTPFALAADAEAATYRVVQEALTNTLRHAGASRADVLEWSADALRITVTDDGRGAGSPTAESGGGGGDAGAGDGGGHGLVGLRERLAAVGGSLSFPVPAGGIGFTLAAAIPAPDLSPDRSPDRSPS